MMWLIWREYRLNRLILISGLAVSLMPYVTGVINLTWWVPYGWQTPEQIAVVFTMSAFYSVVFCQLTMALLGGNGYAEIVTLICRACGEKMASTRVCELCQSPMARMKLASGTKPPARSTT